MVTVNLAGAELVDWTATYPGLLGSWDLGVAGSAVSGSEYRCETSDLSAIGDDPVAFAEGLSFSFGLSMLDEAHITAFAASVEGWEDVAGGATYGILGTDLGGSSVTMSDEYVVLGYQLDGDNLATSGGDPVLLDLSTTWYLPDGFYQAVPVEQIFSLAD